MAKSKTYRIGFYQVSFGAEARMGDLCTRLLGARNSDLMTKALELGDTHLQLRGLTPLPDGRGVKGYIARFRDETPLTGSPADPLEKPIKLDDGDGLIERNHFIVYRERDDLEVIAYQTALEGTHITGLARYLTLLLSIEDSVCFYEILNSEAYQALADGGLVKAVDFRVAKPRNKRFAPDPDDTWTQEGLQFMQSTGATSFEVKISTRKEGGLLADVKKRIKLLLASPQTKKLKVKMSEVDEPIDLLAERLSQKITVIPVQGTITSEAVHEGIKAAKAQVQAQLDVFFGQGNEALE